MPSSVDFETGLAFQGYNDVRIPNENSAREFDFNEDFDLQGPVIPFRLSVGYRFAEKNLLSVLYAPLGIDYKGAAPFDISFQGTLFTRGQDIDGLAGGPGRAFDFFVGGHIPVTDHLSLKAGYRILEGGADVEEVYNFTLINFANAGVIWQL